MKTAPALVHILALGTCFVVQVAAPQSARMPGVRRAIQTIENTCATDTIKQAREGCPAHYSGLQDRGSRHELNSCVNQCSYILR